MNQIKNSSRLEYKARLNKVFEYINSNLDKKINLEKLAEVSCFSPFHFHRVFLAFVNETPNNFINRIRIERSANMLFHKKYDTITTIALSCGFTSSAAFSRAFKSQFGISPTQWREKNKDSKICKIESKILKEYADIDDYFDNVNNPTKISEYKMKIEVKQMPKYRIAYVLTIGEYGPRIAEAYEKLCTWAAPRGLLSGDAQFLGISWDNPDITPKEKCRFYAALSVPEDVQPEREIGITEIKAAKCVVGRFQGPHDDFKKAYKKLYADYLPNNGYQPTDNCYEIYYKDPNEEPVGFDVDICIPVEPL
ncbi:MAG: GyrI-like domain-containing protein [Rhodothermaceae bacterium]